MFGSDLSADTRASELRSASLLPLSIRASTYVHFGHGPSYLVL